MEADDNVIYYPIINSTHNLAISTEYQIIKTKVAMPPVVLVPCSHVFAFGRLFMTPVSSVLIPTRTLIQHKENMKEAVIDGEKIVTNGLDWQVLDDLITADNQIKQTVNYRLFQ